MPCDASRRDCRGHRAERQPALLDADVEFHEVACAAAFELANPEAWKRVIKRLNVPLAGWNPQLVDVPFD